MLSLNDKSFLIDCGEGVQLTIRQMGLKTNRLYSVFISHLHGDHCFGLIGLISTLSMMKRTQPLHVYAHKDLQKLIQPLIDYHCGDMMSFEVIFHPFNPRKQAVIFEDRSVTVETIPLKHKVPTCGFLFCEKGQKRYAYVSDTMYSPKIVPQLSGVDLLYHEATYTDEHESRCKVTTHSTARQAATIARDAEVKNLLIGHFSARVDDHQCFLNEALEVFPNTRLAVERQTFEF